MLTLLLTSTQWRSGSNETMIWTTDQDVHIHNKPELTLSVCKVLFECLYDKKTASFEHKELERTPFHSQLAHYRPGKDDTQLYMSRT